MKVKIEIDETLTEDEVLIKCRELNHTIGKIQQSLMESCKNLNLTFYKGNVEYYLPVHTILFFETAQNGIDAHTAADIFQIKNKLYELEEILPRNFARISKSTIININHIYSIDKNLASSGTIQFYHTHKQVYVSRNYYKILKTKMEERRFYHE